MKRFKTDFTPDKIANITYIRILYTNNANEQIMFIAPASDDSNAQTRLSIRCSHIQGVDIDDGSSKK